MPYIALKPVKFDKHYNIGVMIPNEAVKSEIAGRLIRCGVIQEYTEDEHKPINNQDDLYELINKMKDDELLLLYENTRLKEVVEMSTVSENGQGNETESANENIQPIEVKQDNDNTEINDNKELKRAKTNKPKKV